MNDQAGDVLSHYTLISKVGRGGMGVVWKARDLRLDRIVALKFLPPEFTGDPLARERLVREAKATSALQHANICTVHDIDGSDDGRMFMVMEFYEGETLRERIAREPLSPEEALRIAMAVAEGVAEAHRSGFIHRDITSANIMLTSRGGVKIVDFGLARLADQVALTREGLTSGTVTSMSPEQVRGEAIDLRTDIWSFGVMACEMLTGTLPFRGDHAAAMMYSIINEEPLLPDGSLPGASGLLRIVCARCLTKERDDRPQSMAEVISLLKGAADEKPARQLIAEQKSPMLRYGIIAGVAIAGAGIFFYLSGRDTPAIPPSAPGKVRVGILAFENKSNDEADHEWPELAQSMFFDDLTGREDLTVFDPTTLNNIIANSAGGTEPGHGHAMYSALTGTSLKYIIDGTILKSGGSRALQMRIVSPANDAVVFSSSITVPAAGDLPKGVDTLCQRFTDFLQLERIPAREKEDIRQWLPPRLHNFAAIRAFVTATQYNYKGDSAAVKYLQKAIDLDSDFVSPRVWLISKLVEKGSWGMAEIHFRHLKGLQAREGPFEQAMIDWAGACIAGDMRGQENSLTVALEYSPGNNILLYILGRIKYILQDYRGCVEILTPALATRWEFSPLYYLLGASEEQLEMYTEARAILEQSLAVQPVFPDVYSLLSTMCLRDKDTLNASKYETLFLKASATRGLSPDIAYAALARRNLDGDFFPNAARLYRLAATAKEGSAPYHAGLADALLGMEDTAGARHEYYQALILDSSLADAHFRLGEILERDGKTKESLRHMKTYVMLDSSGRHAQEAQARLRPAR